MKSFLSVRKIFIPPELLRLYAVGLSDAKSQCGFTDDLFISEKVVRLKEKISLEQDTFVEVSIGFVSPKALTLREKFIKKFYERLLKKVSCPQCVSKILVLFDDGTFSDIKDVYTLSEVKKLNKLLNLKER